MISSVTDVVPASASTAGCPITSTRLALTAQRTATSAAKSCRSSAVTTCEQAAGQAGSGRGVHAKGAGRRRAHGADRHLHHRARRCESLSVALLGSVGLRGATQQRKQHQKQPARSAAHIGRSRSNYKNLTHPASICT